MKKPFPFPFLLKLFKFNNDSPSCRKAERNFAAQAKADIEVSWDRNEAQGMRCMVLLDCWRRDTCSSFEQ